MKSPATRAPVDLQNGVHGHARQSGVSERARTGGRRSVPLSTQMDRADSVEGRGSPAGPPGSDAADSAKRLSRLATRAEGLLEQIGAHADSLLLAFTRTEASGQIIALPNSIDPPCESNQCLDREKYAEDILRELARRGVERMLIEEGTHGSARVTIHPYPPMDLPRKLVLLLDALCGESGVDAGDGLVAYKTVADVIQAVYDRTGEELSKHAVSNLIWRLRDQMRRNRINPFLLDDCYSDGSRTKGYRFAIRKGADVTRLSSV